jgi:hypothetical protein
LAALVGVNDIAKVQDALGAIAELQLFEAVGTSNAAFET